METAWDNVKLARGQWRQALTCLRWLGVAFTLVCCLPAAATVELQPVRILVDDGTSAREEPPSALPYPWDARHRFGGKATFEFRLAAQVPPGPQGIYLPRLGNSYRVRLGGQLLADTMSDDPRWTNTTQSPRLVLLPASAREGDSLEIDIVALPGADAGLSGVLQGPWDELSRAHGSVSRWRTGGAVAVAAISMILGALALLVWFNQRDRLYLWYALAEVLWSLRTAGQYLGESMWLPWPWWGALLLVLYCGAFASMCMFGLTLVRENRRWSRLVTGFSVASGLMIVVAHGFTLHEWWRSWRLVIIAVCGTCAVIVFRTAWRTRAVEPMVLAIVFLLGLSAGIRDWWVITIQRSYYTTLPWVTYAWLLFGCAMAWLLANRLRVATQAQARHAVDMAARLASQEVELGRAFAAQRHSSDMQAAQEERRRVLQDMHDGVGHELLGALQVAQEPHASAQEVAGQIQRAMDHLKLTVDALQDGAQDVGTVLGLLRYRLAPRLQSAGLAMEWRVAPIPALKDWDTRKARDLQLLAYEAFTNLLVHSHADRAYFEASFDPGAGVLRVTLADNGRGLRPDGDPGVGNGLASMRARAQRLGAELTLASGGVPGYAGACVALMLRVQAAESEASLPFNVHPAAE